jgi:hypothetical protein
MKHPFLGLCSFKHLICTGLLVLFSSLTTLFGQATKSEMLPKGFILSPSGKIAAVDSLVPSYLINYGSGGALRGGLENNNTIIEALSRFVQIPVLVSEKYSREQALANFSRSVKFNISGIDPEGAYSNAPGQGGNLSLSKEIVKQFLSKEGALEQLFDYQLRLGNFLAVDHQTSLPLFSPSGKKESDIDLQLYRKTLVHWAAAYPWAFYELKNIALKEAIMQSRDLKPLSLFLEHRFQLNAEMLQTMNQRIQHTN